MASSLRVALTPSTASQHSVAEPQRHPTCYACNSLSVVEHAHRHNDGTWGVPSERKTGLYYVVKASQEHWCGWTCTCPDFVFRDHLCKHIGRVQHLTEVGLKHDLPEVLWSMLMVRFDFNREHLYDKAAS